MDLATVKWMLLLVSMFLLKPGTGLEIRVSDTRIGLGDSLEITCSYQFGQKVGNITLRHRYSSEHSYIPLVFGSDAGQKWLPGAASVALNKRGTINIGLSGGFMSLKLIVPSATCGERGRYQCIGESPGTRASPKSVSELVSVQGRRARISLSRVVFSRGSRVNITCKARVTNPNLQLHWSTNTSAGVFEGQPEQWSVKRYATIKSFDNVTCAWWLKSVTSYTLLNIRTRSKVTCTLWPPISTGRTLRESVDLNVYEGYSHVTEGAFPECTAAANFTTSGSTRPSKFPLFATAAILLFSLHNSGFTL